MADREPASVLNTRAFIGRVREDVRAGLNGTDPVAQQLARHLLRIAAWDVRTFRDADRTDSFPEQDLG